MLTLNEWLPCPDCGAPPDKFCKVQTLRGDLNYTSATCKACSFTIVINSKQPLNLIKAHWNYR